MIIKERIQRADGSIKYREYLRQQRLGKGGFAECFVAERVDDKKKYALKIIPKKLLEKPKAKQKMLSQIKLHRGAKHRNICELERAFEDQQNVYMLLELCNNGNLFELIRRRKKLTIPEAQYFIYQLIDGLCYLHNRGMIHRDVKLGNLLLDKNMNLKLADFGLTTKVQFQGDKKHTVCGTPNYIAPEIIRSSMGLGASGHSYQVDIWSTGVIMYLMLIGKAPFQTAMVQKTYQRISKGQFMFPDSFKDNDAKDLIRKILVVDPSKRYTFEQILSHPFMNPKCGIPKELPAISINQAPKLGIFQKYAQEPVKESARNASIMTLRSAIDNSMEEDFDGFNASKQDQFNNGDSTSRSRDNMKGLVRQVFSTTTLSKSLKKLSDLNRSASQSRLNRPQTASSRSFNAGLRNSLGGGSSIRSSGRLNTSQANEKPVSSYINQYKPGQKMTQSRQLIGSSTYGRQFSYIYVLMYRQEAVWNYFLSNGYAGTYQGQYKTLYNKTQNIYFEIGPDQEIKMLKKSDQITNQKLNNRKKFLKNYDDHPLICEPFLNKNRLVYISKIYTVESHKLVLFRLSNGFIQAHDHQKNIHLLITENDLLLLEINNGRQVGRTLIKKDQYNKLSDQASQMYLKVRKIMAKANNNQQTISTTQNNSSASFNNQNRIPNVLSSNRLRIKP